MVGIAVPALNSPLALCDAATLAPADAPPRESIESRLLVFFA